MCIRDSEEPLLNDALARASAGLRSKLDDVDQSFFEDLHDRGLLDREWGLITNDPAMLRFHSMRLYALVWVTNPTTVSSAFGLARQLMNEGEVELAVAALDKVPNSSRHNRMAQLTAILCLVSRDLTESRIRRAARRLDQIPCLLYTSPSPRDATLSRMPSSA